MKDNNLLVSRKRVLLFVAIFMVSFCAHVFFLVTNPAGVQLNVYFNRCGNFLADFLNITRYTVGRNPYYLTEVGDSERAYLPFCYMLVYPFSKLSDCYGADLYACQVTPIAILSAFFLMLAGCFMLLMSSFSLCERYRLSKLAVVPIMLSGVTLFTVERANLIIFAWAASFFFVAYYDSDNPKLRVFAAIMLAIAATIKVYPVIFGLLYVYKKMWKEIAISAAICICLVFLPFLFFEGGLLRLGQLLLNVKVSSGTYGGPWYTYSRFGINYIVYQGLLYKGVAQELALRIALNSQVVMRVLALIAIALSFFVKEEFTKIGLLLMALMYFPDNSQVYCAAYIFVLYFIFLRDLQKISFIKTVFFAVYFLILFTPFQVAGSIIGIEINNRLIINLATLVLFILLLYTSFKEVFGIMQLKKIKE